MSAKQYTVHVERAHEGGFLVAVKAGFSGLVQVTIRGIPADVAEACAVATAVAFEAGLREAKERLQQACLTFQPSVSRSK